MRLDQISVILYTFCDYVQTEDGLKRTLSRLREIGFRNVQVSGIKNPDLTPALVRAACDNEGLAICATHEDATLILKDPAQVVERLQTYGTRHTAYPFPAGIELGQPEAVQRWIEQLEASAKVLAQHGCQLSYHNHHREFHRLEGQTILDRIYRETSLAGEPDTYWIQAGGGSVLEWVRRLADEKRLPLIHLKDLAIAADGETRTAPLGTGNIDFAPVIALAESAGCEAFIIEQDNSYENDRFDDVRVSFEYLKNNYVSD